MPFVDPSHYGHQFNGIDMKFLEMGDDRRVRKRCDRAAQW